MSDYIYLGDKLTSGEYKMNFCNAEHRNSDNKCILGKSKRINSNC
jgi:hypothetical protein